MIRKMTSTEYCKRKRWATESYHSYVKRCTRWCRRILKKEGFVDSYYVRNRIENGELISLFNRIAHDLDDYILDIIVIQYNGPVKYYYKEDQVRAAITVLQNRESYDDSFLLSDEFRRLYQEERKRQCLTG